MGCHGLACSAKELADFKTSGVVLSEEWEGETPDIIQLAGSSIDVVLTDLHNQSDLVLQEALALSKEYTEKFLFLRCKHRLEPINPQPPVIKIFLFI